MNKISNDTKYAIDDAIRIVTDNATQNIALKITFIATRIATKNSIRDIVYNATHDSIKQVMKDE